MPYGSLTDKQKEILRPFITDKIVHDLGAGDLALSHQLIKLGAECVIAIDQYAMPTFDVDSRITSIISKFVDYEEPIDIAFCSWPVNYPTDLVYLLEKARIVVYVGKNTDGTACGYPAMFEKLRKREILADLPDKKNTLIVYGPERVERSLYPEEKAGIDMGRLYSYESLFETKSKNKRVRKQPKEQDYGTR